jgi:hypothetical protein
VSGRRGVVRFTVVTEIGDLLIAELVKYTHQTAEGRLIHNNEIDVLGRVLERRLVKCHRATTDEIRLHLRLEVIRDLPKFGLDIVLGP